MNLSLTYTKESFNEINSFKKILNNKKQKIKNIKRDQRGKILKNFVNKIIK